MMGLKPQGSKSLNSSEVENATPSQLEEMTKEQVDFLKTLPSDLLNQFGLGDLALDANAEDYLSESSVEEADFDMLKGDDFFDMMKNMSSVSPYIDGSTDQESKRLDSSASPDANAAPTSF